MRRTVITAGWAAGFTVGFLAASFGGARAAPESKDSLKQGGNEAPSKQSGAEAPIPFPHPVITEVLFSVPSGEIGDANGDGSRSATGDEFVEVMNPHDRPIDLAGYTLTDRNEESGRQVRFTFPECVLPPGKIAVVFNGNKWKSRGPVGDSTRQPESPNPNFHDAAVFSMRIDTPNRAFSNTADFVLLSDPEGKPIEAVMWGEPVPKPPAQTIRINTVSAGTDGSVQRILPNGPMEDHSLIDGEPYSPGAIPKPVEE